MGDALKKVRPGQKLRIPAVAYNSFVDAAQAVKRQEQDRSVDTQLAPSAAGTILIKNGTGSDRQRYDVVGLGDPIYGPEDNLQGFKNRVVLTGVTPAAAHKGRFAVLQVPLKVGAIGPALVHGATLLQVSVQDQADELAEIVAGQFALTSGSEGSAQILWKETASGSVWALVRLGPPGRKTDLRPVRLAQTGGANGNGSSTVSYTYTVTDAVTGKQLATGVAPEHRRMKCKVLSATRGVAWMEDQICHLILTDEVPDFGACT